MLRKFVLRAKVKIEDLSGQFSVLGMDGSALGAAGFLDAPLSRAYREKNGVGEIDGNGSRGVVVDHHIPAEEQSAAADVEETCAARTGKAQNARDDIRWAGGNVGDNCAQAAAQRS